jgi:hypothetical protein
VALGAALTAYGLAETANRVLPFILARRAVPPSSVLPLVFQPDYRSALVMASAALAGALLISGPGTLARRAAFIGLALPLNPFVMSFLSVAIWSLSWRVLWSFPFILFTGLALTAAGLRELQRWRFPILSSALFALFLAGGVWTTSLANNNHFGEYGLKIDQTLRDWLDSGSDILLPKRQ